MKNTQKIVILGSTGSIGRQALDVVKHLQGGFEVVGLAARDEADDLLEQAREFNPRMVALGDEKVYPYLKERIDQNIQVVCGVEGLCELAALPEAHTTLVALSGAVGILPTLAAVEAGKRVALANKETLVAAGDLVMEKVKARGVLLLPVDSEHSAVFQCLAGEEQNAARIWLTASGGPFRDYSLKELERVTVEEALKHPNWAMGPKITIDSATLMNKGLEVVEAHHLFGVDYDRIEVLVQRESVIHSMVEMKDGAFLAHMGVPDMRIPIQYAFTYPERLTTPARPMDFGAIGRIHFEKPDIKRFPCLKLAYDAGRQGGTMPAVLNAANEVAVQAFLQGRIGFTSIARLVERVMLKHYGLPAPDLDAILASDAWARRVSADLISLEG